MKPMRQGQQNRRGRGRSRKPQNPLARSFESNGPDVKIRGTAAHIADKYMSLSRDAQSSGDRIMAENYLQHAEHYHRIIAAAQAQMQTSQEGVNGTGGSQPRPPRRMSAETRSVSEGGEVAGPGTAPEQPDIKDEAETRTGDERPRRRRARPANGRTGVSRARGPQKTEAATPSSNEDASGDSDGESAPDNAHA